MTKKLSIGVTINLDNYENLRMELEGDIDDEKDAGELVSFMDTILSGMGRGDSYASERIDTYRRKVLSQPVSRPTVEQITLAAHGVGIGTPGFEEPKDEKCSNCGVSISKSQAKLSKLVDQKVLCKKCMRDPI
jgi:hypothetical protein